MVTCICTHPQADHQYGVAEYDGNRWECDLCDCDRFVADEGDTQ